jgi:hypothetical protein
MKHGPWWILGGVLLCAAHAGAQARTAEEVLACMHANVPDALRVRRVEIELQGPSGDGRRMQARLYAQREPLADGVRPLRVMLRIDQPAELAGAAYLIREAQRYEQEGLFVYLPSVRRVRRVRGSFADASMLGTDFSYEEFTRLQGVFGDRVPELLPAGRIDGRDVDVLELANPAAAAGTYTRALVAVDRKTCVPLRLEFYAGGALRKRITSPAASLTVSEGHWYAAEILAQDPAAMRQTRLRLHAASAVEALPERYFSPLRFYSLD